MAAHPFDKGVTLKILIEETGAAPHVINYLAKLGRLPVIRESRGPGYPRIYNADSILIIHEHLEKSGMNRRAINEPENVVTAEKSNETT